MERNIINVTIVLQKVWVVRQTYIKRLHIFVRHMIY